MKNDSGLSSRERILVAATKIAQAHGYSGLNFRDLAEAVGIKAASIYHHFASKADLGAAVARRYWRNQQRLWMRFWPNPQIRSIACATIPIRFARRLSAAIAFACVASWLPNLMTYRKRW